MHNMVNNLSTINRFATKKFKKICQIFYRFSSNLSMNVRNITPLLKRMIPVQFARKSLFMTKLKPVLQST